MKKHNLAFIDLEMTGFFPDKHEIIQIGGVIVRQEINAFGKTDFEIVEEFEIKIKPEHIEDADPVSLKIAGYDPVEWQDAISLKQAIEIFVDKTVGCIMVAHDMARDFIFLEKAYATTEIVNRMHYHKLDTISIAFVKLYNREEMDKFSLRALCEYLGVENTHPHRALSDAMATFGVYKKLIDM